MPPEFWVEPKVSEASSVVVAQARFAVPPEAAVQQPPVAEAQPEAALVFDSPYLFLF